MTDPERTIAAQATAAGQGAIAVIRMSGPGCMDILKQCTPAAFTERLRPRRATLVCIRDAEGAAIDQALVTWFPAPASYTGACVHGSAPPAPRPPFRTSRAGRSG